MFDKNVNVHLFYFVSMHYWVCVVSEAITEQGTADSKQGLSSLPSMSKQGLNSSHISAHTEAAVVLYKACKAPTGSHSTNIALGQTENKVL